MSEHNEREGREEGAIFPRGASGLAPRYGAGMALRLDNLAGSSPGDAYPRHILDSCQGARHRPIRGL